MAFKVVQIGTSANYRIKAYGSEITLSAAEFYVERSKGDNQIDIGVNTTKLIVQNKLFASYTFAETFTDEVLANRGQTKKLLTLDCRGIADLEVEDTVTVDHDAVNITNLYVLKGQRKSYRAGAFETSLLLEDSLITSDDIRYDIGLRYDMGSKYDGG